MVNVKAYNIITRLLSLKNVGTYFPEKKIIVIMCGWVGRVITYLKITISPISFEITFGN